MLKHHWAGIYVRTASNVRCFWKIIADISAEMLRILKVNYFICTIRKKTRKTKALSNKSCCFFYYLSWSLDFIESLKGLASCVELIWYPSLCLFPVLPVLPCPRSHVSLVADSCFILETVFLMCLLLLFLLKLCFWAIICSVLSFITIPWRYGCYNQCWEGYLQNVFHYRLQIQNTFWGM